jgi:hypothetical protein
MSTSIDGQLDESLRDALVAYYLDEVVPNDETLQQLNLSDKLTTPNDLYEYFLLDNQVGHEVETSRVASAISSLQQYVNGILLGMEPGYGQAPEWDTWLLEQWRDQLSQYPLWAANRQLSLYPEVYIDPTLRLKKSGYFSDLEMTLNQGRIQIDTVQDAVLAYLGKFEEVANLSIINGYAHFVGNPDFANATYYFVGKSRGETAYYWRSVDMSDRAADPDTGHKVDTINPGAWTDWKKIALPVSEATVERTIRPVYFNNRLFVVWVDWFMAGSPRGEPLPDGTSETWKHPQLRMSLVYKRFDDTWSPPVLCLDIQATNRPPLDSFFDLVFYDQSETPAKLFLGVASGYKPGQAQDGSEDRYDYLQTVRLDPNYNIEASWPTTPEVSTSTATDAERDASGENYTRLACRWYLKDDLNGGRMQHPYSRSLPRIRSVVSTMENTGDDAWNFRGLQSSVKSLVKDVDVVLTPHSESDRPHRLTVTSRVNGKVECPAERVGTYINADGYFSATVFHNLNIVNPIAQPGSTFTPLRTLGSAATGDFRLSYFFLVTYVHVLLFYDVFGDAGHTTQIKDGSWLLHSHQPTPVFRYQVYYKDVFINYLPEPPTFEPVLSEALQVGLDIFRPTSASNPTGAFTILKGGSWTVTLTPDSALNTDPIDINPETLLPPWGGVAGTKKFHVIHGVSFRKNDNSRPGHALKLVEIELELLQTDKKAPSLKVYEDPALGVVEYIDFTGSAIEFSDGSTTNKRRPIRMNTLFAKELVARTNIALENLLSWQTQMLEEPPMGSSAAKEYMDFAGANGKYFWELFFHLPFLNAYRLNAEARYSESDYWLGYIFNPAHKKDEYGRPDYWMVRPIAPETEEQVMSRALRAVQDPDAIGSAFPVHYRKAIFFLYIRNLIDQGDSAYRQLTPDGLGEAKLWYVRALDLLGPRPDVQLVSDWTPRELSTIAASTNRALRAFERQMTSVPLDDARRLGKKPIDTALMLYEHVGHDAMLSPEDTDYFLRPMNTLLVEYWNRIEARLFNLRHNLTLDGKALKLPLFAPPPNPRDLLAQAAQGGLLAGSGRMGMLVIPHYRYAAMFARASAAVDTLSQLGNALQSLLERKDQAALQDLQQSQLGEMSQFAIDLQRQAQAVEKASLEALAASRSIAEDRASHYGKLADEGLSGMEIIAEAAKMVATSGRLGGNATRSASQFLKISPNVFGLANGGMRYEGPVEGAGSGVSYAAEFAQTLATLTSQAEFYRRRAEEWRHVSEQAKLEMAQVDAQREVYLLQAELTQTQLDQAIKAQKHAEETLAFLSTRFTKPALYQWMIAQTSAFYYQAYDATFSLCLAAEACWQYEVADFGTRFIQAGGWSDAYRGLLSAESLRLNLLRMDSAYLSRNARPLEIVKTVSIKSLVGPAAWEAFTASTSNGKLDFDLSQALFDEDYPGHYLRRIRRVALSFPVVLGAYEDIRATLTQTSNAFAIEPSIEAVAYLRDPTDGSSTGVMTNLRATQQIAMSTGIDDDGQFQMNFDDPRYLPFELTGAVSSWQLALPRVSAIRQRAVLESLNDIILHLRYDAMDGGAAFAAEVIELDARAREAV